MERTDGVVLSTLPNNLPNNLPNTLPSTLPNDLPSEMTSPQASFPWPTLARGILVGVVLAYLGAILVGPLVALLLETWDVGLWRAFVALGSGEALRALGVSLLLTLIAVAVNAVVGVLGALALIRHRFRGRVLLGFLFDLPLAISPVMIGLSFMLLVGRDGLLSPFLEAIDLEVAFSFKGLLIATLFVTLPYTLREVAYLLQEIGSSEEEAATTLGASPLQTFVRVTLPNIRGALGSGIMMTVARSLGEFGAVLVLGGSISGDTQTATTFIHDAMEERQLASAYGMAIVLSALSVGLLLMLERTRSQAKKALE